MYNTLTYIISYMAGSTSNGTFVIYLFFIYLFFTLFFTLWCYIMLYLSRIIMLYIIFCYNCNVCINTHIFNYVS